MSVFPLMRGCYNGNQRLVKMVRTVEAVIDKEGRVSLLEDVTLPEAHRALVTILEDAPKLPVSETALLAEPALAKDWNRPEEDEAWSCLQSEP